MKDTIRTGGIIFVILLLFILIFPYGKAMYSSKYRVYQHEERRNSDPSLGSETVPEDGIISDTEFETHLPIVILDTGGRETQNIYKMVGNGQARDYADPNVTEDAIPLQLSIIDNKNFENQLNDVPTFSCSGSIKMRGASSRNFKKKQYKIKLMDEGGRELKAPLLGMDADEDWILSNSILDATQIRNYTAYNLGGQIMPFTPECRFCELIIKNGGEYRYDGLYLLTEPVKQGKGHVDIADYKPNTKRPSTLIVRDRANYTATTLSTWASDGQLTYGWFTFKYPKEEMITDDLINTMEDELSLIEKTLYSDDFHTFLNYDKYIDVDSFVDYFVINEFFMNYDSGDNSTYYYQDSSRKLTMGPLWDYDNCWDNYKLAAGGAEYMVMPERPWFERLVRDPLFVQKVLSRYRALRKGIFSEKNVEDFIDSTVSYLGNALKRDRSRWRSTYLEEHKLAYVEEGHGFFIDRNRDSYEEELVRFKDMERGHGRWLDKYMGDYLSEFLEEGIDARTRGLYSGLAFVFIVAFIASIFLIGRRIKS